MKQQTGMTKQAGKVWLVLLVTPRTSMCGFSFVSPNLVDQGGRYSGTLGWVYMQGDAQGGA